MRAVDEVKAVAGRGLDGDRYAAGVGHYSGDGRPGRQLTLIELEAVAAVTAETGLALQPGETRRNIVTQGVPLNHLVERRFSVGGVVLEGIRLCEPCVRLESLTREGCGAAARCTAVGYGPRSSTAASWGRRPGPPVLMPAPANFLNLARWRSTVLDGRFMASGIRLGTRRRRSLAATAARAGRPHRRCARSAGEPATSA